MAQYLTVQVNASDTLRSLAYRYMGDFRGWLDIATANGLAPDQYASLEGVGTLRIPIGATADTRADDPYRVDLAVREGGLQLSMSSGLVLRTGPDNLKASLLRALTTDEAELLPHPLYGLDKDRYVASAGTPLHLQLLKVGVTRVILRDPRVSDVETVTVTQYPGTGRVSIGAKVIDVLGNVVELLTDRSL